MILQSELIMLGLFLCLKCTGMLLEMDKLCRISTAVTCHWQAYLHFMLQKNVIKKSKKTLRVHVRNLRYRCYKQPQLVKITEVGMAHDSVPDLQVSLVRRTGPGISLHQQL